MALSRDVVIRLLGDADSAVKAQKAAADAAGVSAAAYRRAEREMDRQGKAAEAAARRQRETMDKVGRAAVGFGAGVTAALGLATRAAMEWESAWAGVSKTVSGTPAQMAKIEQGLRGLARVLPASHTEIAAVAEAAGQLGVQTDSIVSFTRTMIDLGETTNLTADEAATSLAQLMNVMQTAPEDVSRLGATLVDLGNKGASTESDILSMAQRIAGAGRLVGASESDVLALSNALASMGIDAELGGGAITRVFQRIYTATKDGGEALEGFARVAGLSAQDFATAFEKDPVAALDAFIQGLNDVEASGGNVVSTLRDLGIKGTQEMTVLLGMKGAGDLLSQSLDDGNRAWQENTALVEEAAKRYDTTAAKLEIARNGINEAGIEIGQVFLPILADLAEGVADVAGWFADLPGPIKEAVGGLAGIAGFAGLAGGAFLLLAPRIAETVKLFKELRSAGGLASTAMSGLGKAGAAAAGIIVLTTALRSLDEALAPTPPTVEKATKALLNMHGEIGNLDSLFADNSDNLTGYSADIDTFGEALLRITDPSNTERLNDFGSSLVGMGGAASLRRAREDIESLDQSLAFLVESGHPELAAEQYDTLTQAAKDNGVSVKELNELFPEYQKQLEGVANQQDVAAESARIQAENVARLRDDLDVSFGSLEGYAAALGLDKDATDELIQKSNELGESLGGFLDELGIYQGLLEEKKAADQEAAQATAQATKDQSDSWEDYVHDVDVSLDEYMARLEEQVKAQQDWQLNMLILAGKVSEGTLAELARMGPEGAPLVADLVNASDEELKRFDDITALRSKEATDAWGEQLTLAQPVLAQVAKIAGQDVVDSLAKQLQAGTITIADIARQYGISLAGGLNPILTGLGKPSITLTGNRVAGPGIVVRQADGGFGAEDHRAQIAPAGAWRLWAEPETGGEAYIPLAPGKRGRSLDIWRETGRRLNAFADGGFTSADDVPRPPSTSPFTFPISTPADATMGKEYAEAVAWLKENLVGLFGGLFGPSSPSPIGIGGLGPVAAAAREFVMRTWGITNIGGYSYRNIAGTGQLSDHALGKAIDVMIANYTSAAGIAQGNAVANWFVANPKAFGTKYVIWRDQINSGGGWGPYHNATGSNNDTLQHRDHVHVSFYKQGTSFVPEDGLAYLHRGERVVPAAQNRLPVGGGAAGGGPLNVTVQARVFVGSREITDIARVEATAVLGQHVRRETINGRSA